MKPYEFCPYCGIGLSNSENQVGYCKNCKTDFSERSIAEQMELDDDEDNLWDEDDLDEDDWQERQYEEDAERAASCTCGAWVINKKGVAVHVADCYCGAD